jgi:hypothetical protein
MKHLIRLARIGITLALANVVTVAQAGAPTTANCDLDWTGQGATIVKRGGEVMASQSDYVPAKVGMRVENGGRVMTLDDSFAIVGYDDGCWYEMGANELLTIEDVSPCCAVPVVAPPPVAAAPAIPGWVAPAAIAAVIGGIILLNDDDDEDREPSRREPISP